MGWLEFFAAFAAFFASHSIPLRPAVREPLQQRLGRRGFTVAYSFLSLVVLGWLIGAAGRAPYVPLWDWARWQISITALVMLLVCLILALGIARPNPFSFGGAGNELFDPAQPGIIRWVRHPLLAALAMWAAVHVVPNGDVAHVVLFGTFAGFAIGGMFLIDRRKHKSMGVDWHRLRGEVARAPLIAWPLSREFVLRLALGLLLYAVLVLLHPVVIGVSPVP